MPDFKSFFAGKTVTLLGLGLLGRGTGDAAFLAQHCKAVTVTDLKTADELTSSVEALKTYKNITFRLGGHDERDFEDIDFVIKGAGVRLDNPYILHAQKKNIPVYMSTALFAKLADIKTIGVTGTRGKTTTTMMIVEILKRAGKKVLVGGNVRGISTLSLLPEASRYDISVLELDSWQLQGFDSLGLSPHIAVFTNFFPDHMNYYDGDMDRYFDDKAGIFRHQTANDRCITTKEVEKLAKGDRGSGTWKIVEPLAANFRLSIPGDHNLANAALAKAAAIVAGVDDATADAALQSFAAVEGRLQHVGSWQTRKFYNDSNATTQEATLAALKAFPSDQIVLIFGGADKGLPIDEMLSYIAAHKIRAVLIKGTGTDRVLNALPDLPVVTSMPDAVAAAVKLSRADDHIILSPAFASFGVFKNEYDRSDQFLAETAKLARTS